MTPNNCINEIESNTAYFVDRFSNDKIISCKLNSKYNLEIKTNAGTFEYESLLLGTQCIENEYLAWGYNRIDIPKCKVSEYDGLKAFGKRVNIPEFYEHTISISENELECANSREMNDSKRKRNHLDEIESVYSIRELIAIACKFYKAKAWFELPGESQFLVNHVAILSCNPLS